MFVAMLYSHATSMAPNIQHCSYKQQLITLTLNLASAVKLEKNRLVTVADPEDGARERRRAHVGCAPSWGARGRAPAGGLVLVVFYSDLRPTQN